MLDRFKFRVFDKLLKELKYPEVIEFSKNSEIWYKEKSFFNHLLDVDDSILMQSTGIKDDTKWEQLSDKEKKDFYSQVCSEDGRSIKYQNIEDVKHLWKGKLIFEGDIVKTWKFSTGQIKKSVVKWNEPRCGFRLFDAKAMGASPQSIVNVTTIKVIGNIHENPELLEVSNED